MSAVTVSIYIDEKGHFVYSEPSLFVDRGDQITWVSKQEFAFGIMIKEWTSPLDKSHGSAGRGESISAAVLPDARPGAYKYGVSVYDGHKFLQDDPEIIIKPPAH